MSAGSPWFENQTFSVHQLLDLVHEGRIAMPEFQRKFRWVASDIAALLRSVARNWPAGNLLLLKMGPEIQFEIKKINGAPPTPPEQLDRDKVDWLILDGQQRTTALYHALRAGSNTTYYIDVNGLRSSDSFEDEHLLYMRRDRFLKKYPTPGDQAADGIIEVSTIADETLWDRWLAFFTNPDEREALIRMKRSHLPGLVGYHFPAHVVDNRTSLAGIAKIFETINRRGQRLDAFDLMVAMLYPHNFNLRRAWETVLEERSIFGELGVRNGITILQLIALREHLRQRGAYADGDLTRIVVKGVRQSDLLEVDPGVVKSEWDGAITAYEAALTLLRTRCGVVRENLLPQSTMVLALADALHPSSPGRHGLEADLERWFWAACFSQTYGEGANTRVVSDTQELRAWAASESAVPSVVARFDSSGVDLLETGDRNQIVRTALMARLVATDARDWLTHDRLLDLEPAKKIQFHHVLPKTMLENAYYGEDFDDGIAEENPMAVLTPMSASSNSSLSDHRPATVLEMGVRASELEAHLIDAEHFSRVEESPASIREFLEVRQERLRALMDEAIESSSSR